MIFICVKWKVKPEYADQWVDLTRDFTESTRAEEGNLFFEWSQSLEEPDIHVLVEGFRDAAAGASHVGTQAFRDFVEKAPDYVAAQPRIIYVDAPDVSGWGPMGEIQPR
jgi:quinol monooxygenase YgiN